MIIINFKNYKTGKAALDLVGTIALYYNKAIVAVPALDLAMIAKSTTLNVFAQHVDPSEAGRGTGLVMPEHLLAAGAVGSLLNHSEHKLPLKIIKETAKRCSEIGLKLVICASTIREAQQLRKLNPHAIAFEDPKLIASGKSITSHKAHDIKRFVELLAGTDIVPLCGAGITAGEDVAAALMFGCKGVLVSSAVANSSMPETFLKEIAGLV